MFVFVSVCGMSERPSYHADVPLWSQGGLQEVLREDHPGGSGSEMSASQVRRVSLAGPQAEADSRRADDAPASTSALHHVIGGRR